MAIDYRVANPGYPARDVRVTVTPSAAGLEAIDVPTQTFGWVAGTGDRQTVRFRAVLPGRYNLAMKVRGQSDGRPEATLALEVLAAGP